MLIWLIVTIILYMLPHIFGAKPKTKAVYGAVFIIVALLVGSFVLGPGYIDKNSRDSFNNSGDFFTQTEHSGTSDSMTVTVHFDGSDLGERVPAFSYTPVDRIPFMTTQLTVASLNAMSYEKMTYVSGEGTNNAVATCTVTGTDSSKLYYVLVSLVTENADGTHTIDGSTRNGATMTGWNFTGDKTTYTLGGCAYAMAFVGAMFYLILAFTTLMRRKFASTRKKMEDAGRLYPQGYGRCNFCGAIVLPGEVNCRKCGAYIDRPESMKPKKKDCFQCSACGCEVLADALECPKCGAKFDSEENVVTHVDGTTDSSTDTIVCPVCNKHIPANSERCVYCGKKFDE
ncbi:MAG: zinc ribbon domain-containing protein, partial [archaeon]|nr:zinc ribbon domain-containing protein [archaeon]